MTSNVEVLKRAYAGGASSQGRDASVWDGLMADDFQLRTVLGSVDGGRFRSTYDQGDIADYYAALDRTMVMRIHEAKCFLADGDTVAVVIDAEWASRATGVPARIEKIDLWTFRDGRAVGLSEIGDSAAVAKMLGV